VKGCAKVARAAQGTTCKAKCGASAGASTLAHNMTCAAMQVAIYMEGSVTKQCWSTARLCANQLVYIASDQIPCLAHMLGLLANAGPVVI
jgi:hypothetical protein